MSGFFYDQDSTKIGEWPTFVAQASSVAIGNNKSMLSILNASTTNIVKLRQLFIVNDQTTAITGIINQFNLLRMTGHSAGTTITAGMHDTTETLDAGVTIRTGATISGEDATIYRQWRFSTDEWGVGAHDVESSQHIMQAIFPVYRAEVNTKPITLRQNQGIHVKHITNSTAGSFNIIAVFTVEPL